MDERDLMHWRVLFFVSLGVNLALLVLWLLPAGRQNETRYSTGSIGSPSVKTNVLVRRQFFSWAEVESPDYATYIANLRDIGCPEQTIRDIIIADVNTVYARRRAIDPDIVTPEQQWWRSDPDTNALRIASEKIRALDEERRALLTRLLGPNWESGDFVSLPRPSRPGLSLDGSVLGSLPNDVKQAIEDISVRAQDRLQAYLDQQRQLGKNPDPAELARLRQQTRNELTGILNPAQLEEYLLRYSQNANNLRAELGQLAYFNATPDEFRAMFRATDSINQQLEQLAGATDANSLLARRNLELQRDNAIKLALGQDRYKLYTQLHDDEYREAYSAAQTAGAPESAQALYEIRLASAIQQAAIRANTNLSAEQRTIEMKKIELEQLKASALAMGQDLPDDQPAAPPPVPTAPPITTHPYVLGVGETPASVALRYGVSLNALRAANPDLDFRRLKPGDAIQVPDSLQPH